MDERVARSLGVTIVVAGILWKVREDACMGKQLEEFDAN